MYLSRIRGFYDFVRGHRYELIALLTSGCVMVLEIVGARLVSPYFGASLYTWTAMIGSILGALSLGFWYGGRLADRKEPHTTLAVTMSVAAVCILGVAMVQEPVLEYIAAQRLDVRISTTLAVLLLFSVPSFLIGMVSPHLAKIRLTSLRDSGATIGRLEAAGAIGSIVGTFLAGYWLLSFFGARAITVLLAAILILTSFLAERRWLVLPRIGLVVVALLMAPVRSLPSNVLTDVDTSYSRYQVTREVRNGRAVHYLLTDAKGAQSAQFVDAPDEPVFAYIRQMQQIAVTYPDVKRVLIIGGGAFTLPQLLVGQSEDVRVDIVEIDPGLGELSERYFNYQPHPRIATHFEDGRNYLNRDQEPYDLIFLDAFNSLTPPFHLTTLEAAARMWVNLTPDGAIVTNVIDRPDGDFIASMTAVHKRLFRDVEVFAADPTRTSTQRQNLLLLSTQGPLNDETRQLLGKSLGLSGKPTLLTDDYAPVERMTYH